MNEERNKGGYMNSISQKKEASMVNKYAKTFNLLRIQGLAFSGPDKIRFRQVKFKSLTSPNAVKDVEQEH